MLKISLVLLFIIILSIEADNEPHNHPHRHFEHDPRIPVRQGNFDYISWIKNYHNQAYLFEKPRICYISTYIDEGISHRTDFKYSTELAMIKI